jgi:hypothetical protein
LTTENSCGAEKSRAEKSTFRGNGLAEFSNFSYAGEKFSI